MTDRLDRKLFDILRIDKTIINILKKMYNALPINISLKNLGENVKRISKEQSNVNQDLSAIKLLMAKNLINIHNNCNYTNDIQQAEFKIFSQWGDEGIIQYIINRLQLHNKTFIEFGVQDYRESNTRFLLMNNNWSGLVLDGAKENIDFIKNDEIYWKYDLNAIEYFITKDNINSVIASANFSNEIGLLSIDIDGNDYWVWESITVVKPIVVIIEFNAVFGSDRNISIPYSEDFIREKAHYSYLYFGASLSAMVKLGIEKGYTFIGTNTHSVNAYFIKTEYLGDFKAKAATDVFIKSKFSESRDQNSNLNHLNFVERQDCIRGLPVQNLDNNQLESF